MENIQILLIGISAIWTVIMFYSLISSWVLIPPNKYKGRLAGEICMIFAYSILLAILWVSSLGYKIDFRIWDILIISSLLFFLLKIMFSIVERRDMNRKFSILRKKYENKKDEIMKNCKTNNCIK